MSDAGGSPNPDYSQLYEANTVGSLEVCRRIASIEMTALRRRARFQTSMVYNNS